MSGELAYALALLIMFSPALIAAAVATRRKR